MNIQLTLVQWFIVALVWLSFGTLVDVLKLVLATLGNSASKATGTLKDISRIGRIDILKVDPSKIEFKVVKDISRVFGQVKCSLLSWSTNFLRQVVEPEINPEIDNNTASQSTEEKQGDNASYLVSCENDIKSIFNKSPENKHAGQQIIGALIGFLALLAFLYADAAQGAQTFKLLFKEGNIPPFLNEIILPLIMASAGSALILGVFIGDILGLTHLGLFNKAAPKSFLWIISVNLILSLSLSTFIALARMELLGTDSESVKTIVNIAQSVVILPMLVTTFLLFRGISGIYVALSIILSLLAVPFGIFEFFIRILIDLILSGLIGGNFIITRIIWLTVGALELVFLLLELAIKGSFSVLTYLLIGIFFIPNLIFRIILRVAKQDNFYAEFLGNLLVTKLKTEINDDILQQQEPPPP
jgi:hypothetical protein